MYSEKLSGLWVQQGMDHTSLGCFFPSSLVCRPTRALARSRPPSPCTQPSREKKWRKHTTPSHPRPMVFEISLRKEHAQSLSAAALHAGSSTPLASAPTQPAVSRPIHICDWFSRLGSHRKGCLVFWPVETPHSCLLNLGYAKNGSWSGSRQRSCYPDTIRESKGLSGPKPSKP